MSEMTKFKSGTVLFHGSYTGGGYEKLEDKENLKEDFTSSYDAEPKSSFLRHLIEDQIVNYDVSNKYYDDVNSGDWIRQAEIHEETHRVIRPYRLDEIVKAYVDRNHIMVSLSELPDKDLFDIAFEGLRIIRYGPKTVSHYQKNDLSECFHDGQQSILETLPAIKVICDEIGSRLTGAFGNPHISFPLDISEILKKRFSKDPLLSFREYFSLENILNGKFKEYLGAIGVFGGIQQVIVEGVLHYDILEGDSSARYYLNFTFRDIFGVDEEDVINWRPPAIIQRMQLAAFWVLQHQRGYAPFINTLKFEKHFDAVKI
jgi:hypothetical protein